MSNGAIGAVVGWSGRTLALAGIYALAGKLALGLAIPPGYATAVWPAAGIALAAVLLMGYRILPGVVLGSFLVNVGISFDPTHPAVFQAVLVAMSIGVGAALQAAVGAALIRRFVAFPLTLMRERDVLTFLVLGGPVAGTIAATWGIATLLVAHVITPESLRFSWLTWWVGDTIGTMIFCPLVLLFFARPSHVWRPRRLSVGLPLCITFVLAVLIFVRASGMERARASDDFEHKAQTLGQVLQRHVDSDVEVLRSVQGLFSARRNVDRDQFHRFVAGPIARHRELLTISWDECVPDSEQANNSAIGFDVASDPIRARSLALARDNDEPTATDTLSLLQSKGASRGLVIYVPVYEAGVSHDSVEERRRHLRGYLAAVFEIDTLISASLKGLIEDGMDLSVYDDLSAGPQRLIYHSPTTARATVPSARHDPPAGLLYDTHLDVGGRHWTFRVIRPHEYLISHPSWNAWLVLVRGLLFTGLLGGFLMVLTGRTSRIEELVAGRTAELCGANARLEAEIRERHAVERELREARRAADAANQAKSSFLANMSHEIRTPLNCVIGYAELLLRPSPTSIDPRSGLETIGRNARHLLELLNDILDFSRIESGHLIVTEEPVDLAGLSDEITQMMRPQAIAKGLQFDFDFVGPLPRNIITDRLRLRQILVNLIGNAIKFTTAGGVRVRLSAQAAGLDRATEIRFEVSDSGIGMTPGQLRGLFRPFSQADASTTRRFGGSGLGLVISRRLAKLLRGDIGVESRAGEGSTFTLSIRAGISSQDNLVEPHFQGETRESYSTARDTDERVPATILVAEDGLDNQRLIAAILEDAGATVVLANNGREAVELASVRHFDVILMDIQMPVLDGYGAAAEIRAHNPIVPIIALTACATTHDRTRAMLAGYNGYLTKPVDPATLLSALSRYATSSPSAAAIKLPTQLNQRSTLADNPRRANVLKQYIEELPADVAALADMLGRGQLTQLAGLVHQVRGSGGAYGFPKITELATHADEALSRADLDQARVAVRRLIEGMRDIEGYDRSAEPRAKDAA